MEKFKIGDRVILKDSHIYHDSPSNPIWGGGNGYIVGTIHAFTGHQNVKVSWDNGQYNYYMTEDLELHNPEQKIMCLNKNKTYIIDEVSHLLRVGMKVVLPDAPYPSVRGEIGEIDDEYFFVWQNKYAGAIGTINPSSKGYTYSWKILKNSRSRIQFMEDLINPDNNKAKTMCDQTTKVIRNLFKKKEQKALEHYEIVNGDGGLTEKGQKEFIDFVYETGKTEKAEFVKIFVEQYDKDTKK